ncbi:RWP-RK domain-containing protein, partial [Baffinella frigidus]
MSLQALSVYFDRPEKDVAKDLGCCLTSLKKLCRLHGIMRWPYRKIKSRGNKLRQLESAMGDANGH